LPATEGRAPLPESASDLAPLSAEFWDTLDAGLAAGGLTLDAAAREAIERHVRLLLAWNSAINLTALRTAEQIARSHVLDSLIALPALRSLSQPRGGTVEAAASGLLDIGSGAGFPGLQLAVTLPLARVALVDSIGKKARFLGVAAREVSGALTEAGRTAPDIQALAERAEDLADEPDHREGWSLVTARAVGTVAELAELGLPLAKRGGHVVAWKLDAGDGALKREVADAARIIQAVGGGPAGIIDLPAAARVGLTGHCLVVIEKRRPTPDRYPRPAGERRRAPLLS
jgi:16S rRNA (guanine527-N7)-methyltransferase